jgi:hypothetical protein
LFLLGFIKDKADIGNYITFKARFLFLFDFDTSKYAFLKSGEQLIISKENQLGYIGTGFIIGVFNGAVL